LYGKNRKRKKKCIQMEKDVEGKEVFSAEKILHSNRGFEGST
jgi:hypothetical protein